jgi:hypothetical protein
MAGGDGVGPVDLNGESIVTDAEFGKLVSFNGTGALHNIVNDAVSGFPFSLSIWAEFNNKNQFILGIGNSSNFDAFSIIVNSAQNNRPSLRSRSSSGAIADEQLDSNINVGSNNITHCVGVWASATERHIYVNGVLRNTGTASVDFYSGNYDIIGLGRFIRLSSNKYTGKAGEFRIYDRQLSEAEIVDLYQRPYGLVTFPRFWPVFGGGATQYNKTNAGALTPTGAAVRDTFKAFAGSLTPAGVVAAAVSYVRSLAGSLTGGGTLARNPIKSLAGALAPLGGVAKSTGRVVAGTVIPTGALDTAKTFLRTLTGTMALAGTLGTTKTFLRTIAGTLAPIGSLARNVAKPVGGVLSPTGFISRSISKILSGDLIPGGVTVTVRTFLLAITGSLTPTGAINRQVGKQTAGDIPLAGSINRAISKAITGALGFAGSLIGIIAGLIVKADVEISTEAVTILAIATGSVNDLTINTTAITNLSITTKTR